MKIFMGMLMLSLAAGFASAADLAWNHDGKHDLAGFTLYYQDTGTGDAYMYTLADPAARKLAGFEKALGLLHGHSYNLYLTAYNAEIESKPSNSVGHQVAAYDPPPDKRPIVIEISAPATVIITQP